MIPQIPTNEGAGDDDSVRLELDGDAIPLSVLVSAAGTFANLVFEVSKTFRGGTESVEWTVEVQEGSIIMPSRPQLPHDARAELVRAISFGVATLEERPERPAYFNERALAQARALANLSTPEVGVQLRNGGEPTRLTKQLVANVDRLTQEAPPRKGTIEGRLEAVDVHGRNKFSVWDRLTGDRVECIAGENISVDDLGEALGKRVAVRGRIRSTLAGTKRKIDVQEIRVFPAEEDLPSADDVRGILRAS